MALITISSEDAINWNAKTATEKKINQVANILKTRKGEIPFLRGVGMSDEYIDKPISLIKPILINNITETIRDNVEGVSLHSVNFTNIEATGNFTIKVVCDIE